MALIDPGAPPRVRNEVITLVQNVAQVISEPKHRRKIIITNSSGNIGGGTDVTIHFGSGEVVVNQGLPLKAGLPWEEEEKAGYTCYEGAIQAMTTDAGGATVSIVEW